MKKTRAVLIVLVLLLSVTAASAAAPGTITEPLISRNFLENEYATALKSNITVNLNNAAENAMSKLDELYRKYIGFSFASSFTKLTLASGDSLSLTMGSSFVLTSGAAEITVTSGEVINISTGAATASGTKLALRQRYFCTENTTAIIKASAASIGQVDGLYLTTGVGPPRRHPVFRDIKSDDWYYGPVDFVYKNGLFSGTAADLFAPNTAMTRAMFVTVLHRLDGLTAWGNAVSFSDVKDSGQFYYYAVAWASSNGIVTGYADGTFRPNDYVSREQMAVFMHRYAAYKGLDMSAPGGVYDSFPDKGNVSAYATDAMRWVVSQGIINGSNGRLIPQGSATRAQVAQIMFNYCEKFR